MSDKESEYQPEDEATRFARELEQYYGISGQSGTVRNDMRSPFWKENAPYKVTPQRSFEKQLLTEILSDKQPKPTPETEETDGKMTIEKFRRSRKGPKARPTNDMI